MAEPGRECGRLTPGSGGAHPVLLPGPKVWVPVLAPPQSSYVTSRRLLSLSLLICKMDGLDKWGASGAATGKSRTSGVPSDTGVKKERALANTLGYSLCGLLATHRELLRFWTQYTDCPLGELVLPNSAPCASMEPTPAPACRWTGTQSARTPRPR